MNRKRPAVEAAIDGAWMGLHRPPAVEKVEGKCGVFILHPPPTIPIRTAHKPTFIITMRRLRNLAFAFAAISFASAVLWNWHAIEWTNSTFGGGAVIYEQSLTLPLCKRADIRQGKWADKLNATTGSAVMPTEYQWLPNNANNKGTSSSCQFQEEFNSTLFCNLMTNAVIMFIGDSITFEMYQSLVHLTGGKVSKRVQIRAVFKKGLSPVINTCGNNNVTLVYRWSKHLDSSKTSVPSKQLDSSKTSVPIEQMLDEQFPVLIVLNTGAHWQSNNAYHDKLDKALDLMKGWQRLCQERNLTCPFFWRTTSPGTPKCMDFTKPVNNISQMEDYIESNPLYQWEKFRHQNHISLEMLKSSEGLSYEIIDGYEIGIQRPDLHVSESDCLHHRDPAIADAYNVILLHHLRASRTVEDILRVAKYSYNFSRVTNVRPDGGDYDWGIVNN